MSGKENFQQIERLGDGTFAVTYKARILAPEIKDHCKAEVVAIKVPWNVRCEVALQTDIQVLAALNLQLNARQKRNVVRFLGAFVHNGVQVIVMEYVQGGNLRTLLGTLDSRKRLSLEEALPIMKGILSGLQAIHKNKIIHRDLKPENILMADPTTPMIADFGISRFVREDYIATPGGTYFYRAPEMYTSHAKHTFNADLWSAGVMFYEMLYARWPFGITIDTAVVDVMKLITDENVRLMFPEDIVLPDRMTSLLARLLEKNPQKRYKTANAVLRDLAELEYDLDYARVKQVLNDSTQKQSVLAMIEEFLAKWPGKPGAYILCGTYFNECGQWTGAADIFEAGVANCPDKQGLYLMLAMAHDKAENYSMAMAAVEKGLALFPDYKPLNTYRVLLKNQGQSK